VRARAYIYFAPVCRPDLSRLLSIAVRRSEDDFDRRCWFGVDLFGSSEVGAVTFDVFNCSKPFCIQKIIIKVLFFLRKSFFFCVPRNTRECLFVYDGRLAGAQQYVQLDR